MRALGSAQADVCCIYMNVNQAALMTGLTGMSLHVAVLVFVFFSQSPHGGAIIQSCGVKMYGWPRNHRSCHCVKKQANHPLTMNQQFIHGTVWRHRCEDTLGEKKKGGFLKCEIKFRTCTLLLNKHIKKTLQVKPWEHLRLKSMFYGSQG